MNATSEPRPRFVLTLEAIEDPAAKVNENYRREGSYRLRLALKHLLRVWGLRCVSVSEPKQEPTTS